MDSLKLVDSARRGDSETKESIGRCCLDWKGKSTVELGGSLR